MLARFLRAMQSVFNSARCNAAPVAFYILISLPDTRNDARNVLRLHNHPPPDSLRVYKTRAHPGQRCAYDISRVALSALGTTRNSRVITAYNFFFGMSVGIIFSMIRTPREGPWFILSFRVHAESPVLIGDITERKAFRTNQSFSKATGIYLKKLSFHHQILSLAENINDKY